MSFTGDITARPPRVSFTNLSTGETVEMPHTPPMLEESLSANWNRQVVLGMSHTILQYSHTENHRFDAIEFFFKARSPDELAMIHNGRRFLFSLCYPVTTAAGIQNGSPPRVLFYWPKLVSMTCIITEIGITHEKFNREGQTVDFRARVSFEEIRDFRLLSDVVRTHGTIRSNVTGEES